jgi:hypothetical protein
MNLDAVNARKTQLSIHIGEQEENAQQHRRELDRIASDIEHVRAELRGIDFVLAMLEPAQSDAAAAPEPQAPKRERRAKAEEPATEETETRSRRNIREEVLATLRAHPSGIRAEDLRRLLSEKGTVNSPQISAALERHAKNNRAIQAEYGVWQPILTEAAEALPPEAQQGNGADDEAPSAQAQGGSVDYTLGRIVDLLDEAGDGGLSEEEFWDFYEIPAVELHKAERSNAIRRDGDRFYAN